MESERHLESVLSKLMGLDRLPPQSSLHGQQRVLSEKYLWNIASLENAVSMAHRERWLFDDNLIIDVDEQLEIKDACENHLGSRIDGHHKLTVEKENSLLSTKEARKVDAKNRKNGKGLLEGQSVLHFENPAYCFKGLNCNENLYYLSTQHPYTLPTVIPCPRLGHLTVRRSTAAFASATEAEVEVSGTLGRVKSFQKSESRSFAKCHVEPESSYLKKQVKSQLEIKEPCLSYARFDPTLDNGSVNHTGRTSFSACCLSSDMKQKYSSSVRSKGIYFEARGSKNFQDICMVPGGIAKQITSQIKDSMWHRYSKISASESRSRFSSTKMKNQYLPPHIGLFQRTRGKLPYSFQMGNLQTKKPRSSLPKDGQ
ncbi:hypothetical protein Nepgr_001197 [Nepenthes gracilis]|uniref:Uncharacterized protein n=1 Tax=Nepenthes gracilis TaxID=150966 RepID=A0AAD3RXD8_NEPGR|nr:hypothetical protein Nepgr_001197 [Nepenthes gracilis]